MQCGWNECVGIGVDVHVHRISGRLGWTNGKTPEDTRKVIKSKLNYTDSLTISSRNWKSCLTEGNGRGSMQF